MRKLTVVSLVVGLCLMGVIPVLAQKTYSTLAEYEKLTGKKIEAFNEAPMLKAKVAAGELPLVEERLPDEPMVVEPLEQIGRYGGGIKSVATSPSRGHDVLQARAQYLFRLSPDLKTVIPNIAKGWDLSEDMKTLTIHLRRGMRWSDGASFTADDFLFWYEDIILNDELTPVKPKDWRPGGKLVEVEKLNDYTVRFQFAAPYPVIINKLAVGYDPFAPKHYLKKWHIKYNPKANEVAKKEGYDYWWMCFNFYKETGQGQQDINLPSLNHWVLEKVDSYGNKYYERNPYFWKVDTAGNQLPYIDKQTAVLIDTIEIETLKAIAGEFDYVAHDLMLKNYPLYKKGEEKGKYRVMLWDDLRGSELVFGFNVNHKDPILRKIFNDLRFRQAMSLAINRKEINNILFFGKATPRQATTDPGCSLYEDWMGKYYAEYDPERANRLLDEIGLKWDKKHQYRLRPDDKAITITIEYPPEEGPRGEICELVKDYWEKVGVNVAIKEEDRSLYQQRGRANERDLGCFGCDRTFEFAMRLNACVRFRPPWSGSGNPLSAAKWWDWYNTDGKSGEEPPEEVRELFKAVDEWQTILPGTQKYMRLGKKILTVYGKNLWVIGTVGLAPWPVIMKNDLRNTPRGGVYTYDYRYWYPYQAEQWFFEK